MVDHTPQPDAASAARLASHAAAKAALAQVDDETLCRLLADAAAQDSGHGIIQLPDGGAPAFAKLLPLSDVEADEGQRLATRNLFELPCFYQYRLGSLGFGAWRELAAQELTTSWVRSGSFSAVPLLHGWRVLPVKSAIEDDRAEVSLWGGDLTIARRIEANRSSTRSLVLFMEPYPQTFAAWLGERLADPRGLAVRPHDLEASLLAIVEAMNTRGLLHMDAHLENFLTDGETLVLGDYGLATAQAFDLSPEEEHFLETHASFDSCTAITGLVQAFVARYDQRAEWHDALREVAAGNHVSRDVMPEPVRRYLAQRAPVALTMHEFYVQLLADLSGAEFPAQALERALDGS